MPSSTCNDVLRAEFTDILQEFLSDIGYELPHLEMNPTVEDVVKGHFQKAGFTDAYITKLARTIQTSVGISIMTYQTTCFEVQCIVAIYTTYNLIIDDRAKEPEFQKDLKRLNIHLANLAEIMIIKDTLQFMSGCYHEAEGEKLLEFPAEAPAFVDYFRMKVGLPEGYAFMLFPTPQFSEVECLRDCLPTMPSLMSYINWLNDIMSFYKEVVEVDECNFIGISAKAEGVTQMQFLRTLCKKTTDVVKTLRALGSANEKLGEALEGYIQGYVVYHLTQKRYRLADLGLPLVAEAEQHVKILL